MKNIINFRYVQNLANSLNRCACIIQFRDLHNQGKSELHIYNVPPPSKKYDLIGPPDKKSNLRPVVFHVPQKETALQCRYRLMRKETHDWNQAFWANHNERFFKEKEDFVRRKLDDKQQTVDSAEARLSADELSEFYKAFLDKNYPLHANYNRSESYYSTGNREWYHKNLRLLFPAFQVFLEKIYNKLFKR
nr:cytochrome c oxidase assembly factor 8 isoform X1 [Crassostrea gigas]